MIHAIVTRNVTPGSNVGQEATSGGWGQRHPQRPPTSPSQVEGPISSCGPCGRADGDPRAGPRELPLPRRALTSVPRRPRRSPVSARLGDTRGLLTPSVDRARSPRCRAKRRRAPVLIRSSARCRRSPFERDLRHARKSAPPDRDDHCHTSAPSMRTSPSPDARLGSRRWRSPPEGRRTFECTGVDDVYCSGRTDQDHVASAAMAGSMPAWAPRHSGAPTRALRCSPDRVGAVGRRGEGVTVPPWGARVAAKAKAPRHWSSVAPRGWSTRFSTARDPP